jgi:hypothetical protein
MVELTGVYHIFLAKDLLADDIRLWKKVVDMALVLNLSEKESY